MRNLLRWWWDLLPGNPMVVRTVQGGSRRMRHLWVRMGYLGLLTGLVVLGLLFGGGLGGSASMAELAQAGTRLFGLVAYGQVILVCLLAPLFMAAAIRAEQTGQTYNILLTTPLSALQIVLGALGGRLFFVLSLLASGLPLFAVVLIFGGVPVRSIFAAFLIAALVALVVGSVAVALAVMGHGGRRAVFVFIIAVAGYLLSAYAADQVLRQFQTPSTSTASPVFSQGSASPSATQGNTTWLTPLHPILVLEASLNKPDYRPPSPEEIAHLPSWLRVYRGNSLTAITVLSFGLSFALVSVSAMRLRSVAREGAARVGLFKRALRLGRQARVTHPPRRVGQNPIAWRESHTRGNSTAAILARIVFLTLALLLAAVLIGAYHFGRLPTTLRGVGGQLLTPAQVLQYMLLSLLMVELVIIVIVALYTSAGSVSGEREDGTLDLIQTTPITPRYYVWGKLRGLVAFLSLLLAAPLGTLAMVCVYTSVGLWRQWPSAMTTYYGPFGSVREPIILPEAALLWPVIFVPFVAACVAVGMGWSIKSRGVISAVVGSVGVVGGLMLVLGFCGSVMASRIPVIGPVINALSPTTGLVMLVNPWGTIDNFAGGTGSSRVWLWIAAVVAGGVYAVFVYGQLTTMVRGFDQRVRELSGG